MKKYLILVLVFVLTLCVLTGCRSRQPETTTTAPSKIPTSTTAAPTTMPTTATTTAPSTAPATAPTTGSAMEPGIDDMIPGAEDTIDPSNGANDSTGPVGRSMPRNR